MHKPTPSLIAFHFFVFFVAIAPRLVVAQEHKDEKPKEPADKLSITDGHITIHGEELKYKATAGHLILKDDANKPKAEMFFVAYEKQPAEEASHRALTFVFNGGPGAAAVWLHLGTAGPKRISLDHEGNAPPPPYKLEDNPNT